VGRTIGKLAAQADVDVETIRYYQRINLIDKPAKPLQGWRTYPDEALRRVKFIKRAQSLGFSLDEIRGLLSLNIRDNDRPVREKTEQIAKDKLEETRHKIRDLQQIETTLSRLVEDCPGDRTNGPCPILENFRFELPKQLRENS
jgi:MerR family mercuric resistance operon transcriptional regulator